MLKELNATGRRKLPVDAPTEFLPQRLKPIVINHGEIDRRAWELAAVMAHGCNLSVYTMAQLTCNVTYEQLKRIGDWHLTEEAQRRAPWRNW
jgi:Tn3 transposase DDE domain